MGLPSYADLEKPTQPRIVYGKTPLPESVQLVVVSGPDAGASLPLSDRPRVVGKSPRCDLVLRDRTVSRVHLEVTMRDDGVHVRDLGSKNGTFYRDVRFTELSVPAGAVVALGETELKIAPAYHRSSLLPSTATSFGSLLGTSLAMRQVYAVLECVCASEAPVLIQGESGTGKDLAAESIHRQSLRSGGPFVVCDAASPLEASFSAAQGGTLLLDHVADLTPAMQAAVLRAVDRRGNVRLLAASSRNLSAEVKAARFRLDLYHRLAVVRIELPPLRERPEDIPTLVAAMADKPVPPEVLALLVAQDWPGNVRELRNVVERACALTPRGEPLRI